jgi:hypothetical protein
MRTGKAEIGENAIAHEPGHKAVVTGDDARAVVLIGADDPPHVLGIDRRIARIERDVGISVETLALFGRFWLTTTPTLPEPAAQAARAQAGARYDNFVTALGRRLHGGPKLRQEIPEDVNGDSVMGSQDKA